MYDDVDMLEAVGQSFTQYAGAVLQSRVLTDVRDCVKPSARQIYYAMFTDGFTSDKPFKKTLKAVSSGLRYYIHGDASCVGIIMRSGQPFSMRYPLVEVEGSYGNQTESGNWSAPRYTSSRLSGLADSLIQDTGKHTIDEWVDNYDDTEQYPRVLSSLGFYNIVNGATGIGIGIATSIPQFNLTEVNDAMIRLLRDPKAPYDEIYCAPDFATGGTVINASEVKESLRTGSGKPCVIQGKYEYDKKSKAIVIIEFPYGVFANTICCELEKLAAKDPSLGIKGINDLTSETPCLKIYIDKKVDPDELMETLYQSTSLRTSYSINMVMLEDGRFPKTYGWRDALLAHLGHERHTYINLYNYDLGKARQRLKIVDGLLCAMDDIDKVVHTIKDSKSTKDAAKALQELLWVDAEQASAILAIKLSTLANMERGKLEKEKSELEAKVTKIEKILGSEKLLTNEIVKNLKKVAEKFGDKRRTEVIDRKIARASRRKSVRSNIKFDAQAKTIKKIMDSSGNNEDADTLVCLSNIGKVYRIKVEDVPSRKKSEPGVSIGLLLGLTDGEHIVGVNPSEAVVVSSDGYVKRINVVNEFSSSTRNKTGLSLMGRQIIGVAAGYDAGSTITISTNDGWELTFAICNIPMQGKSANGVVGIKLHENDTVRSMQVDKPGAVVKTRGRYGVNKLDK